MIKIKGILIFCTTSLFSLSCVAQNIKGYVHTQDGKAVPFASVMLLKADSSFVAGTMTGENGSFSMPAEPLEGGLLKVSCLGYTTQFVQTNNKGENRITLQNEPTALAEVVVKGNRPTYKQTADGIVTNVAGTVLEKLGTAVDALAYVPMLRKNGNGYEVFGKGTPIIYINGRKVRDLTELDRLRSVDIKDVTLLTHPGAAYDATAPAVLKIRTVPKAGDGFGMNYRQVLGQAHKPLHREQLDLNYRHGGWDAFATLFYSQGSSRQEQTNHQYVDNGATLLLNSRLGLYSKERDATWRGGLNYQINERHSIGATYTMNIPLQSKGSWWSVMDVTTAGGTEQLQDRFASDADRLPSHDITAYYAGVLGKWHIDWNGEAYLTRTHLHQQSHETGCTESDSRDIATRYANRSSLYASKIVGTTSLGKGNLTVGNEVNNILRNNRYTLMGNGANLPGNSDDRATETTVAAFTSYDVNLHKMNLSAGLRYEFVQMRYFDHGKLVDEQSTRYNNLFPSLSLSFPLGKTQLSLSYTAKTARPSFSMLSSNVQYNDRYTYQGGNQALKAHTLHSADLNLTYHWFSLIADWHYYRNGFFQYIKPWDDNPIITEYSYRNVPSYHTAYIGAVLSPKFGIWQPMLDFGVNKQWLTIHEGGATLHYSHPIGFVTLNQTFQLPHGWILSSNARYNTAGHSTTIYWLANGSVDVSIYKSLLQNRLSLQLQFTDLLHTNRTVNTLVYGDRGVDKWNKSDSRGLVFTLRYQLNAAMSKYKGVSAGATQKNRL